MKFKRLLPLLLVAVMCGGIFAGCGDNSASQGDGGNGDNTNQTGGSGNEQGSNAEENNGDSSGDSTGEDNTDTGNTGNTGDTGNTGGSTKHEHTYSDVWTSAGEEGHYHMATCKHVNAHDELVEHRYSNERSKVCLDCGYVRTLPDKSVPLAQGSTIYVVGDSTVCSFSDPYYLPRYGYGTQLSEYLNVQPGQVNNLAISGRSSKSFLTEDNYTTLKNNIKAGDYLIIGFGHNDEKSDDPARFTDPKGNKDTEIYNGHTSLKWCLYQNYIKLAEEKGATPILCTPIVRYDAGGNYDGSKAHITSDGNYPQAIKDLGEETGTTVIDLTALTKAVYEADNENAQYYHAFTTHKGTTKDKVDGTEIPDGRDDTHINEYGAKMVAYQFSQALLATECPLAEQTRTNLDMPTKEVDYLNAINSKYKKPPYKAPDLDELNPIATTGSGESQANWYSSAFGVLGGDKANLYGFGYDDGTFEITADGGSKFAASQDGMGAIFTRVDISKNFTASVKATLTDAPASVGAQNSFGLMLRDDMYINVNNTTVASNFVAASIDGSKQAIFSRKSPSAFDYSGNKVSTVAVGTVYELTITRVGQAVTVTVKCGNDAAITTVFTDFDFVAIDNDYMYLCMYANRGLKVEFSELTYTVTGISQGA